MRFGWQQLRTCTRMLPSSRTVSFHLPITMSAGMPLTALISEVVRGPEVLPRASAPAPTDPPVSSFWLLDCR